MIEKITLKDIPDTHIDIANYIGIDNYINLVKLLGGTSIYIPKEESLTRPIRNKIIKQEFNGNYKELSKKYNVTQAQIRNILSQK